VSNAEPSRRASTIETVEGDDDVLNIDRRSMLKYVMSALALLAVAVLGVIGYRALSAPSRTVPNLIGMTEAQAANVVADNGWELEVRRVRDDGQAQGDVVRTDPASGDRLRSGGSLVLVVSDGPTLSALPNVTGLDVDNARSALSAVGLTMREAQQLASETVPLGTVISWSVPEQPGLTAGSQVPKGTTIEVVVSSGSPNRTVPNLNGLTVEEATARLALGELVLGSTSEEFSTTVGVGRVIASNPAAEADMTVGGAVNVVVSKGPDLVKMPKVGGSTLQAATDALIKAGLKVGSVTGGQDGTVSWSNVSAGDLAVRGTAVALTMLAPPPTTTTTTTVARPN
jgi:serine/threonine-protein kinase